MSSVMDLFRIRNMETPSPYESDRIAFIDPLLMGLWCTEYSNNVQKQKKKKKKKKYSLPKYAMQLWKGESPQTCPTKKQWVKDVDTLYIAHLVNNNHWVAVEINLIKGTINVLDSAIGVVPEGVMRESMRAYEFLIVELAKLNGHNMKPFAINMVQNTPANLQSGDCGVYTLKFIELSALGLPFTGLEDKSMRFIRRRYAIDIMKNAPKGIPLAVSGSNPRFVLDSEMCNTLSQGIDSELVDNVNASES